MSDRATAPESATILKAILRKTFRTVKFSVRLSRGTGYGYCSVSWTDGPSESRVREITGGFEGEGFDGMTDSSYSIRNELPDGRRTGLRGIHTARRISAAFARRLASQVAEYYGGVESMPVIVEGSFGYRLLDANTRPRPDVAEMWDTLIHRASVDSSRYAR